MKRSVRNILGLAGLSFGGRSPSPVEEPKVRKSNGRPASTYRGARRNAYFGREPTGNTPSPRRRNASARPMPYKIIGRFSGEIKTWGAVFPEIPSKPNWRLRR